MNLLHRQHDIYFTLLFAQKCKFVFISLCFAYLNIYSIAVALSTHECIAVFICLSYLCRFVIALKTDLDFTFAYALSRVHKQWSNLCITRRNPCTCQINSINKEYNVYFMKGIFEKINVKNKVKSTYIDNKQVTSCSVTLQKLVKNKQMFKNMSFTVK